MRHYNIDINNSINNNDGLNALTHHYFISYSNLHTSPGGYDQDRQKEKITGATLSLIIEAKIPDSIKCILTFGWYQPGYWYNLSTF